MKNVELPYTDNPVEIFKHFAQRPYAMLLNSCRVQQFNQRFSIFSTDPKVIIMVKRNLATISKNGEPITVTSTTDPFNLIKQQFNQLNNKSAYIAMGYLSYDLAKHIHPIHHSTICDITLPEAVIGFYDWKITIDHHKKTCCLTCNDREALPKIHALLQSTPEQKTPFKINKRFRANMTFDDYSKAFHQIQHHIHEGDCYEVNLCQRYTATYQGSPWHAYEQVQAKNPSPFSAYFNTKQGAILSFSPERFLCVRDGLVEAKPIKGTSVRYANPLQDRRSAQQLLNSEKDRAENLMIVDLLRNDLGKNCQPGTIKVSKLFDLESFPNVHHLVSTITGQLKFDRHALDVLYDCFPGGSITGAPKLSAMRIIENLEPHHRSVYCGNIFHLDSQGNLDSNIAIRTCICNEHKIHCYAGGAIVTDSKLENEYEETRIKVGKLLEILENM